MNQNWTDLDKDGRRLNRIIRQLESKIKNETKDEMKLAYIDRIIKCTHEKSQLAQIVLGVKEVLKEAKKRLIISTSNKFTAIHNQ